MENSDDGFVPESDGEDATALIEAALKVVALNGLPFTFMQKTGMKSLIEQCAKQARRNCAWTADQLPSERTLRRAMVDRMDAMQSSNAFKEFINRMKEGCTISYHFGNKFGKDFLTVFGHTIDNEFQKQSAMLVFKEYNGPKRIEDMRSEIEEELAEIDLSNFDIDSAFHLTDEGSNMQIQHFQFRHACTCHVLDKIIAHTTKPYATSLLNPDKKNLLGEFNAKLGELRVKIGRTKYQGLIAPTHVRFFTDVSMVESFIQLLAAPIQDQDPRVEDFTELAYSANDFEDFLRITKPLKKWIIDFEVRDRSTINLVLPLFALLEAEFLEQQQLGGTAVIRAMAESALEALDRKIRQTANLELLQVAAGLDPNFWHLISEIEQQTRGRWSQNQIMELIQNAANHLQQNQPIPAPILHSPFARFHAPRPQINVQNELNCFIATAKMRPMDNGQDVLDYWANETAYPSLKKLARRYLTVPAGNIECERAFSIHTWLRNKQRSRLSSGQIGAMMINRNPFNDITNN